MPSVHAKLMTTDGKLIEKIINMVDPVIDLSDVFYQNHGNPKHQNYHLKGFICYYHNHYVTVLWKGEISRWVVFNDSSVVPVSFIETLPHCVSLKQLGAILRENASTDGTIK